MIYSWNPLLEPNPTRLSLETACSDPGQVSLIAQSW